MVKRPSIPGTPPKDPVELCVPPNEAKERLRDRIERGQAIAAITISTQDTYDSCDADYKKWDDFNKEMLRQMFSSDQLATEYDWYGGGMISLGVPSLSEKIVKLHNRIRERTLRLDSILERIDLYPIHRFAKATPSEYSGGQSLGSRSKRVFVVHGHDEISKTNLEVFLHENGFEPVVLHRQADEGMTVIEKIEKHSDVGYAFILLTPDEVAYLAAEKDFEEKDRKIELRARPNVIFEFGYFVGKLGRSKVCCLYTGDVSLPSDVSGMIYKKFEKSIEEIGYSILKDLRASGYTIA
jgi:predicted nucleotide-binding protein